MKKQHDYGGQEILEKINFSDAPLLLWEKQVHAVLGLLALKKVINVDELRRAVEQLDPAIYSRWSYYGKWACAIAQLLIEKGILRANDIMSETPSEELSFAVDEYVAIKEETIFTKWCKPHIRTPGYIYGMVGRVDSYAGSFPDPQQQGWGLPNVPTQHTYRVRFYQKDIWPDYVGNDEDTLFAEVFQNWLRKSSEEEFLLQKSRRGAFSLKESTIEHGGASQKAHSNAEQQRHSNADEDHDHHHHHHHSHGHSHKHQHEHKHDHAHSEEEEHQHDERPVIEQTALDREVNYKENASETFGAQFAEIFVKVVLNNKLGNPH
jgi:hypothetical protein